MSDTQQTVSDLIGLAETSSRLVARGKEAFDSDEAIRLAAEAVLHKIGEAVSRLPDEFLQQHPEVSWRAMRGMRNVVAHQYEQMDYQLIWNALAHRLPPEAEAWRSILDDDAAANDIPAISGSW